MYSMLRLANFSFVRSAVDPQHKIKLPISDISFPLRKGAIYFPLRLIYTIYFGANRVASRFYLAVFILVLSGG